MHPMPSGNSRVAFLAHVIAERDPAMQFFPQASSGSPVKPGDDKKGQSTRHSTLRIFNNYYVHQVVI
jgi:hypothetical protein